MISPALTILKDLVLTLEVEKETMLQSVCGTAKSTVRLALKTVLRAIAATVSPSKVSVICKI
jgi:hypothetical protein